MELKSADFLMRQKWAAEQVADLSDDDALQWAVDVKDTGNEQYRRRDFAAACDTYLMALVGLRAKEDTSVGGSGSDSGSGSGSGLGTTPPPFSAEQIDRVQVPVLCNLAACKLALKVRQCPVSLTCSFARAQCMRRGEVCLRGAA